MTPTVHFFTKASDAWKCPKLYYWRYVEHLIPKDKSTPLVRGGYVHAVLNTANKIAMHYPEMREAAFGQGMLVNQNEYPLSEDIRDEANNMALEIWGKLQAFKVLETEKVLNYEALSGKWIWRAKLDSIIEDPLGQWQGEYKTTSNYASNMQRLYHQGIQPFIYLNVARHCGYKLQGTKMFIATKPAKTVAREACIVEDVIALTEHYIMADTFMHESAQYIAWLEDTSNFSQNRTQCVTLMGECSYRPLCKPGTRTEYYKEVKELMYLREDPLKHLEES